MRRKLIAIRVDPKIWQTAREAGLNISRLCEKQPKTRNPTLNNF